MPENHGQFPLVAERQLEFGGVVDVLDKFVRIEVHGITSGGHNRLGGNHDADGNERQTPTVKVIA